MHSCTSHSESETYVKHVSAFDTYHFEMSSLKSHASLARVNALDMSHLEMSPLKDAARRNISFIVVTLDTSHFDRSPLNDVEWWNSHIRHVPHA